MLDDEERSAVLAHELAHLRLRHHRLLRFARVVSDALGTAVPAAREAAALLARELEVTADQPTDPVGGLAVGGVTLAGIGWLSWNAMAPAPRSVR